MTTSPNRTQLDVWRNRAKDDVDFVVDMVPLLESLGRGSIRSSSLTAGRRSKGDHSDPTANAATSQVDGAYRQTMAEVLKVLDDLARVRTKIHMTVGLRVCPSCRKDILPGQDTSRRHGALVHDNDSCVTRAKRRYRAMQKAA